MRTLVVAVVLCIAVGSAHAKPPVTVDERTIAELQAAMQSGQQSSRSIVEAYLKRIRQIDPKLKSIVELNPDALAIAAALDRERKAKGPRGPLHGIPIVLKDNIATADRMQTTAGSLALVGVKPPRDAFVVERLRAAGAVILGKTNLSEWANIRSTHSSSGWSARGGQTHNPYALDRTPCGSSSGTGAAIAASLATVGIGTETDGSIVCPSSSQSLVGLKPTVGLVSRSGIVPISRTQDTAGPMARTVADAAALLTVLAAPDPSDPATVGGRGPAVDYSQFLDENGLAGARIGVVRAKMFGQSPAADRVTEAAIALLKQKGAIVVDPADIPHLGEYDDDELKVLLYEVKAGLASYLADWAPGAPARTVEQLVSWNAAHPAELRLFGQELFEQAARLGSLADADYQHALERCRKLARTDGIEAVLRQQKLDALVAPTAGPPWLIDPILGDHAVMSSSTPAAVAGTPAITVPAGFEGELPIGITFMGKAWDEATLIRIAYAYERASRARRPPRLLATVKLD